MTGFQRRCRMTTILTTIIICIGLHRCGCSSSDQCHLTGGLGIYPESDITIGTFLDVHESGNVGLFGCSDIKPKSVQIIEAMKWTLSVLNKNSGKIYDQTIKDSFIPGVKIGMEFFDSCGHKELATKHLAEFLPTLISGYRHECSMSNQSTIKNAGIIDLTQMGEQANVINSMRNFYTPRIAVDESGPLPAHSMAMNLIAIIRQLQWTNIVIVNADDEFSIRVVKAVGQLAARADICISSLHVVPTSGSKEFALKSHRKVVKAISDQGQDDHGVLVIANGDSARVFLQAIAEAVTVTERKQWFFSSVVNPMSTKTNLGLLKLLNDKRLFSLVPHPVIQSEFIKYWQKVSQSESTDGWLKELQLLMQMCKSDSSMDECSDFVFAGTILESIIQTQNVIPAIHATLTFAHALRSLWKEKCEDIPGVCPKMIDTSHEEFLQKHLQVLNFQHNISDRSPQGLDGGASERILPGKISNLQAGLLVFDFDRKEGFSFREVMSVEEGRILSSNLERLIAPSVCIDGACRNCISVRQSRLLSLPEKTHVWTYPDEYDVLIPIILPIHEQGSDPLECGQKVNAVAIQSLDALIYSIDRINNNTKLIPDVKVGAIVLDTCSSTLKTAERISNLYKEGFKINGKEIDTDSILAFITTTAEDHETAVSMLAPMNVTTISASQVNIPLGIDFYNYQVSVPDSVTSRYITDLLVAREWKFVTLVAEDVPSASFFRKYADEKHVCIADNIVIPKGEISPRVFDDIVSRIISANHRGSMFIVLWVKFDNMRGLFAAVKRAIKNSRANEDDFNWIGTEDWAENLNVIRGFEDLTKGAIVVAPLPYNGTRYLSDVHKDLRDGPKNVLLERYFHQVLHACSQGEECHLEQGSKVPVLKFEKTQLVPNIVQSSLSIASSFGKLHKVICKQQSGICSELYLRKDLKYLKNYFLQYSFAPLPEDTQGSFHFTEEGFGNRPMLLRNLRFRSGKLTYTQIPFDKQLDLVIYDNRVEMPVGQVTSECRQNCRSCRRGPRHMFIKSPDDLYIAAVFPVHDQDKRSLECGQITSAYGIQNMEAVLWAVDIINRSQKLLPWIKLGVIGIDTCSNKEKTVRDVYNLFTESDELGFKVLPHQIAGVIVGSTAAEVDAVLSITEEFDVTTMTPDVTSLEADRSRHLIQFALPNRHRAMVFTQILKTYKWTYASVVYLSGKTVEADVYQKLVEETAKVGITFGAEEGISGDSVDLDVMKTTILRLKAKLTHGSKAVVLLLPPQLLHLFFQAAAELPEDQKIKPGDFLWIIMDEDAIINDLPMFTAGSVIIRPNFAHIPQFAHYFQNLKVQNNSRDTWFREYMQGPGRYTHRSLDHGESAVNTINAVYALAQALEKVRFDLCPSVLRGLCDAMKTSHPALRADIQNRILSTSFRGSDLRQVKISSLGQASGQFQILNYRLVNGNQTAFVDIGSYDESKGLLLNASRAKGYDKDLKRKDLTKFVSRCISETCQTNMSKKKTTNLSMPANFQIGGLLAIHQNDKNFFKCGKFNDDGTFQNLLAMTYAADQVNSNYSLLPDLKLGMMLLDYCGRPERAQKELFSYFSTESISANLIGTVFFDPKVAKAVNPILEANNIPQLVNPSCSDLQLNLDKDVAYQFIPLSHEALLAASSILEAYDWRYVTVIRSNTPAGKMKGQAFKSMANGKDVCVTSEEMVDLSYSVPQIENLIGRLRGTVVMMVDDFNEALMILNKLHKTRSSSNILWVLVGSWAVEENLYRFGAHLSRSFMINMDTYNIPEFRNYYKRLSLDHHEPIPDDWFEEFWQKTFDCKLPHSKSDKDKTRPYCSGLESLQDVHFEQDERVYYSIKLVNSMAVTLHSFLLEYDCYKSNDFFECVGENFEELRLMILKMASKSISRKGFDVKTLQLSKTGRYELKTVGRYENENMTLNKDEVKMSIRSECEGKVCENCFKQIRGDGLTSRLREQQLDEKFSTVWGLITTSLSLLGILLVIICILYFLMAFPITTGTTVLGYFVLVGVLLIYGSNFAFIVAPTVGTCSVRRVLMSVAYAIVFSGLLIKAFNTWRLSGYSESDVKYHTRKTRPTGLLFIAVGLTLIQAVLVSAWMILKPPDAEIYQDNWHCSPAPQFEVQLVASMTYCALLLLLTLFFSGLSWNCDENHRESRWIFVCCSLITVTWFVWMLLATLLPVLQRDQAIVASNIVCASIIMLLLYLRKVYLYSKFSKQVKDFELTSHLKQSPFGTSMYGACRRPSGISRVPEFIRGSQLSVSSDFTFEAPNSTVTDVTSEGSRSCASSAQVQGTDLYPMEVYDGGSQFQAQNISCSSRGLVLDDVKQ